MESRGFTTLFRFDRVKEEQWASYIEFSKLKQLDEVLSLDCVLCPTVIKEYEPDDWTRLAMDGALFGCFADEAWARRRAPPADATQLVCIEREPAAVFESLGAFVFEGLDLIEGATRISALTNCGGFPLAFEPEELNSLGLLTTLQRAKEVQAKLLEKYPSEEHADTIIYAIYRIP